MAPNFDICLNHSLGVQDTKFPEHGVCRSSHHCVLSIHLMQPSSQQPKTQAGNFSNAPNSCTSLQIMTAWI